MQLFPEFMLQDSGYAGINPVEEHTVHPVNMFTG